MSRQRKPRLVVGVGFSPRRNGNSDRMLEWALAGAQAAGARARKVFLRDLVIRPCRGCRACESTGQCVQKDDFDKFFRILERADALIFSTPVFFLNLPGQAKAAVDRFQAQWSRQYLLGRPARREKRPALILMAAGADQADIFDCVKRTLWAWFTVAGFKSVASIGAAGIDQAGAAGRVPNLESRVRRAAEKLVKG